MSLSSDTFAGLDLHPEGDSASATFESAAATARAVAENCLPLGIALVMHLYPLCALRCVSLPWWSAAGLRRSRLVRAVSRGKLILANAGSERAAGAHEPVSVRRTHDGVRVDGTFDYVSLAHSADIVLFSAPFGHHAMFCAADLHRDSVRIGDARFNGSMRLSDTCSVTFADHHVPAGRCIEIATAPALQCMAQYQRSWFQLLLCEIHLARIEHLQRVLQLSVPVEQLASFNELARLREYASRLLDEALAPAAIVSLAGVTEAMKLRVSLLSQATAVAVRARDETAAAELEHIQRQPTSDDRILQTIAAANLRQTQGCKRPGSEPGAAGPLSRVLSDTRLSNIAV